MSANGVLKGYVTNLRDALKTAMNALEWWEDRHPENHSSDDDDNRAEFNRILENTSLESLSELERDGMPTFYIGKDGTICTHRLGKGDEPVWCSAEAFKRIAESITLNGGDDE